MPPAALVFLIGSAVATLFSWPWLWRRPREHGFYRFFAFECLLGLTALRLPAWFDDPFSWHQLISWFILLISAALAAHSFFLLGRMGRPHESFENTTVLVRSGAYRWIRHPLYASLLWLGLGEFFKQPDLAGVLLFAGTGICLALTARVEERENLDRFGPAYEDYCRSTRRFIPFLY